MFISPWYKRNKLDSILAIKPEDIIVFDVETTGLEADEKDEILQLAIINGKGEVLFSDYIKPQFRKRWTDAQQIHGITPSMVKDKRTFIEIQEIVQEIFTRAKLIIGYNLEFDLGFIEAKNIRLPKGVLLFDVMIEFAPIGGRWNDYRNDFKWMKLAQCARYYKYNFNAHDALEDVKATLWCFDKMLNDYEECGYRDLVNNYRNSKTWQIRIKEKKERRDIKSSFQIKDKYPYPNEYTDKLERWNKYNLSAKQYKKLIELENKQNKPIYDEITDEIYHCFLIGREWEIEQTIEESVLNDIREKCKVFGGRLFKTKAKTAKFAILKTVYDREYTTIKLLQAEGYKVTTFEEALKYMGLEDILQQEEFYKEQLEETHNKESWYKVFFNKVMGLFR